MSRLEKRLREELEEAKKAHEVYSIPTTKGRLEVAEAALLRYLTAKEFREKRRNIK